MIINVIIIIIIIIIIILIIITIVIIIIIIAMTTIIAITIFIIIIIIINIWVTAILSTTIKCLFKKYIWLTNHACQVEREYNHKTVTDIAFACTSNPKHMSKLCPINRLTFQKRLWLQNQSNLRIKHWYA